MNENYVLYDLGNISLANCIFSYVQKNVLQNEDSLSCLSFMNLAGLLHQNVIK